MIATHLKNQIGKWKMEESNGLRAPTQYSQSKCSVTTTDDRHTPEKPHSKTEEGIC